MSSAIEASEDSERREDCADRIQEACDDEVALNCMGTADGGGYLWMISSTDRIKYKESSFTGVVIGQIANRAKSLISSNIQYPRTCTSNLQIVCQTQQDYIAI